MCAEKKREETKGTKEKTWHLRHFKAQPIGENGLEWLQDRLHFQQC